MIKLKNILLLIFLMHLFVASAASSTQVHVHHIYSPSLSQLGFQKLQDPTVTNRSFQGGANFLSPPDALVLEVCDDDYDGISTFTFEEILTLLDDEYNTDFEEDVIYIAKSYDGLIKIENVSTNPTIVDVCSASRSLYEVAVDQNQDVYVSSSDGIFRINTNNCNFQSLGNLPNNANIAMSFDTQNNLYVGGRNAKVYRADAGEFSNYYEWHDFGSGQSGGDFVVIGEYMYIAWALGNNNYLYQVTLDADNQFVSYENLGQIEDDTYGMAAENGRLYGVTPDLLYEIDVETMETTTVIQNPSSVPWWGAAGLHEAIAYDYSFHASEADANSGDNPLGDSFENTIPYQQEIFIRVLEEYSGAVEVIHIQLIVNTPPETTAATLPGCSATGEYAVFDLEEAIPDMIIDANGIGVSYYLSQQDAESESNPLANPSSFQATASPQTIYVRFENESCVSYNTITLENDSSTINLPDTLGICADDSVTITAPSNFDSYQWEGLQGNDVDQNNPNANEITVSQPGTYILTVTYGNGCSLREEVEVVAEATPDIPDLSLPYCSDNATLQLSVDTIISDLQASYPDYIYELYEDLEHAQTQDNPITGQLNVSNNQDFVIIAKSNDSSTCYSLSNLTIEVQSFPPLELETNYLMCEGDAITISIPGGFDAYNWIGLQDIDQANNNPHDPAITLTQPGDYSVEVANENCVTTREFTVAYMPSVNIQDILIEGNTVTIQASGDNVEYSLDNIHWTNNPTFTDVENGLYTVYVRDDASCGMTQRDFTLFALTNVITPNADGYNDVWYVKGLSNYPGSTIEIYDRYGKLMVQRSLDGDFYWNGLYHGSKVSSGTYWYILRIADGRNYSGYITVKNY